MRGRAVRRVYDDTMEVEPVVSYSLIPPDDDGKKDDERVEPRLTVLPMERRRRVAEVEAPTADDAADHEVHMIDEEATVVPPRPRQKRPRREALDEERPRRRVPRILFVGLFAIILGVGVLAFTFMRVMNNTAAVTPAEVTPAVDVPAPPSSEDSAGPGVLALPPEATANPPSATSRDVSAPAATDAVPPAGSSGAAAAASDQPPPLPRLRPTTDAAASAPAAAPAPPAVTAAPVATAPAASSDSDVDTLMQDVGRILAAPPAAPASSVPADVTAGSAPAAPLAATPPPSGFTDQGATTGDDYPPLPPPSRRRGWFTNDGSIPVPPADIPDAEGAPGQ